MSFTTKYATPVNIMFDENPTAVATPDNTLHLFALNGIQTKDFEKTVNTERLVGDQRQIIKNPVRFKQLEISSQSTSDASDIYTNQCSKIFSLATPGSSRYTHLQLEEQSYAETNFKFRNIGSKAAYGSPEVLDTAGGQTIAGNLSIKDTVSNNVYLYMNLLSANVGFSINASGNASTVNRNTIEALGKDNSMTLAGKTTGVQSTNKISLGDASAAQLNTFQMVGLQANNAFIMGSSTHNHTNTFSMTSGSGGSNNMYLGDATVPGQLILSGTQPVNKIVTSITGVEMTNSTIPTTLAITNLYGYSFGVFSMGYSFAGITGTLNTGFRRIAGLVYITPGNYTTIDFTTTSSTNTVLTLSGMPYISGTNGLVLFNSYVNFEDGSYSPITARKVTIDSIAVTIRGNGFTGINKFEIPVFTYVAN